jgi:hypothetical protein
LEEVGRNGYVIHRHVTNTYYHSHPTVRSLLKRYDKAVDEIQEMKAAFEELCDTVDEQVLEQWKEEEQNAMALRGEHLRVYDVKMEKGLSCKVWVIWIQ